MKKNKRKKIFHRLSGLTKLGSLYLCHNCREEFTIYEHDKIKCPACGNEKEEK